MDVRLGKLWLQTAHALHGMQAQLLLPLPLPTQAYSHCTGSCSFGLVLSSLGTPTPN